MKKEKKILPGVTERFLQICDEVIREGQGGIKTKTAFATSVGEHQSNLSLMAAGKRNPTIEQLFRCCELYGYNGHWLLMGKGDKKAKVMDNKSIEERLNELEKQVATLTRQVRRKG